MPTKRHGFEYDPRETECVIRLEGRGSQAAHRKLQEETKSGHLTFQRGDQVMHLSVANVYTHLGQKQNAALSIEAEISARLAVAQTAFGESKTLLRHKGLSLQCKTNLARSLIFTKLLYAAETWVHLSDAQMNKLNAFVIKMYRCILNRENRSQGRHVTDRQIWATVCAPSAHDLICAAKLRHLGKIATDAPDLLVDALREESLQGVPGWHLEVRNALDWMHEVLAGHAQCPSRDAPFDPLLDFVRSFGHRWKAMCRRALDRACTRRRIQARIAVWQEQWSHAPADTAIFTLPPERGEHVCPTCQKRSHTPKDLAVHSKLMHSKHARARYYMADPLLCLSFGNTQKLRQHLQRQRTGCLAHLEQVMIPLSDEEISALQTVSMRQTRNQYRTPAIRVAGPPLPSRQDWANAAPNKPWPTGIAPHGATVSCETMIQADLADWFFNDMVQSPPPVPAHVHSDEVSFFLDFVFALQNDGTHDDVIDRVRYWFAAYLSASSVRQVCGSLFWHVGGGFQCH